MKLQIKQGTTSRRLQIYLQDTSNNGNGFTGITYATTGLNIAYWYDGATSATVVGLSAGTPGTYSSGGFSELDSVNLPGVYELGIPDGALQVGNNSVVICVSGVANLLTCPIEIELVNYDPYDGTRMGMTALPNAAAAAVGGLYTRGSGAGQINQSANGQIDVNLARVLNTAVSAPATAGVLDVNVRNINNVVAATPGASGGVLISGSNTGTTTFGALTVTGAVTYSSTFTTGTVSFNALAVSNGVSLQASGGTQALKIQQNGTADAILISGGSTSGNGITITTTSGVGLSTTFSAALLASIADKLLGRSLAEGADGGRTVQDALRFLRNKWTINGTTLTVYQEDDATAAWTGVVTATPGAAPITANDPT